MIAVEPMVNMGTKKTKTLSDHWTQSTSDGKYSAHFEHTIAMTADGPWVLTAPPQAGEEFDDSVLREMLGRVAGSRRVNLAKLAGGEKFTKSPKFRALEGIWRETLY